MSLEELENEHKKARVLLDQHEKRINTLKNIKSKMNNTKDRISKLEDTINLKKTNKNEEIVNNNNDSSKNSNLLSSGLSKIDKFKLFEYKDGVLNEIFSVKEHLEAEFTLQHIKILTGDMPILIKFANLQTSCSIDNFPKICTAFD